MECRNNDCLFGAHGEARETAFGDKINTFVLINVCNLNGSPRAFGWIFNLSQRRGAQSRVLILFCFGSHFQDMPSIKGLRL